MRKTGIFSEKICLTAASQCDPHKAPVRVTVRRAGLAAVAAALGLAFVLCAYTVVSSLLTVQRVNAQSETLRRTAEAQGAQLQAYAQQIGELEGAQAGGCESTASAEASDGAQESGPPQAVQRRQ